MGVLVGWIDGAVPGTGDWRPVSAFGKTLAVILVSRYDDPPAASPVRYDEVIFGVLLRRGLRFVSCPMTMLLDEPRPVSDGVVHYSLPKVLDPSLVVSLGESAPLHAEGDALAIDAVPRGPLGRLLAAVPGAIFGVGIRVVTAVVPAVGVAYQPHRSAVVALRPRGRGRPFEARRVRVRVGARSTDVHVVWGQVYDRCSTWLGPPSDFA